MLSESQIVRFAVEFPKPPIQLLESEMMMKDGIPSVTPVCFGGYGASSFQFSGVKSRGGINGRRKDA
ncbi:hypothetical protein F2Q70_00044674 [Brassica cretica]|uniref:Uncharacterized protein n=2 Tax=Brassica cretica TaxID=69181 RepID=A0A8S9KDC0_BRACR|nr:hypothetical protein F2Q70_00044674 [Brassica cretica]KAF2609321.1 hypothetical protein F2Q68_00045624 [Brassica cretica]KAF3516268.1 hypothetical protein DY000_02062618 [Brassica cretica]